MAEGEGFEPPEALPPQRFSRPPSLPPELTGLDRVRPFLISSIPLASLTIPTRCGHFRVHWHQECTKHGSSVATELLGRGGGHRLPATGLRTTGNDPRHRRDRRRGRSAGSASAPPHPSDRAIGVAAYAGAGEPTWVWRDHLSKCRASKIFPYSWSISLGQGVFSAIQRAIRTLLPKPTSTAPLRRLPGAMLSAAPSKSS